MPSPDRATLHTWLHHWQDEFDAAYLYDVLASQESDAKKKETYRKLAGIERRHTELWAKLLGENGHPIPAGGATASLNARGMAWLGRRFGPRYLLPLLLREEGREGKGYMDLHQGCREEEELALVYETKGIDTAQARRLAAEVMANPDRALDEQVREELKIGAAHSTPLQEGWITGVATAVGALIPVAPFLVLPGRAAMGTAFGVAMVSHFAVGAARSFFTGRGVLRSGVDMFVVGLGGAAVGYVVGNLAAKLL